ncbi:TauD/TfdA family dioxygenase [Scytonema sp. UIC 10036]|uniref:TauD/TfdA dioxygenase family protein n=1 Tax=Scytonema sp. UIC 10036 TaxID=2304196 RepID=UPI0012DA16CF|nr:TauD/TfdA family dioxygenase [Scytonema sp. UIC 10036]MUG93506.1 TauD/TfdA family dioxygenase [Scytonema sp. UIC 10036]
MTLTTSRIAISPTTGALGAIVTGVDASRPVEPEVILQLKQAWRDYHLLIFQNQTLTEEQLLAFANYFGDIFQQPAYIPKGQSEPILPPLVLTLSNAAYEESSVNLRPGNIELLPHIDHHWLPAPSSGSLLYAVEVPEGGPDTYWVNLVRAYEELDDATKEQITGLQVIHYNPFAKLHKGEIPSPTYGPGRELDFDEKPIAHPLVRTHPDSGKKILYLNAANEVEIVDYDPVEGAKLIERLRQHIKQPKYVYQHHWTKGDLLYWDNQATAHYRPEFDANATRILKRVSIRGSRPF